MAIIHQAELRPTKMELLNQWLPGRPWFPGPGSTLEKVGAFRFDDPDGEVGLETILVGTDDVVFQVPLSYRGAPWPGPRASFWAPWSTRSSAGAGSTTRAVTPATFVR